MCSGVHPSIQAKPVLPEGQQRGKQRPPTAAHPGRRGPQLPAPLEQEARPLALPVTRGKCLLPGTSPEEGISPDRAGLPFGTDETTHARRNHKQAVRRPWAEPHDGAERCC